jgi:hypothetical protein
MEAESRLSAWARRGAVLMAALASVATSQAGWQVDAKLPVGVTADATGRRLVVEGSQAPSITAKRASGGSEMQPACEEPAPWAGHGTYYLPPGFVPPGVSIQGHDCSKGGGMCSACEPPVGAFVRVVKVESVAPWSLTATGEEQTTHVDATHTSVGFLVEVDATRPVELEAEPTGGDSARLKSLVWHAPGGDGGTVRRFSVTWYPTDNPPLSPAEVRWIPRATLYGYCTTPGECRAPAEASVKVVSVTPQ